MIKNLVQSTQKYIILKSFFDLMSKMSSDASIAITYTVKQYCRFNLKKK